MRIFLHFLVFVALDPWDRGLFCFPALNFITRQTSRISKIMPCKNEKELHYQI